MSIERLCQFCHSKFFIAPYQEKRGWGKFCSRKCQEISWAEGRIRTCQVCRTIYRADKQSSKSKFCSAKCRIQGRIIPVSTRLWGTIKNKVPEECWLWEGVLNSAGYGVIRIGNKGKLAHRIAYNLAFGLIPKGMLVLHRCDIRNCVNPDHLFIGTQSDNRIDCINKGRGGQQKLTREDVIKIRRMKGVFTPTAISRMFNVTPPTIANLLARRIWKHVA